MSWQASTMGLNAPSSLTSSLLDTIVRDGAERMLQAAIEAEVAAFLERCAPLRDEHNRRAVVRNGRLPERQIATTAGPLTVSVPRVRDRRARSQDVEKFTSAILPPYARKSPSLETLLPVLYLKGISTGDFREAFETILGPAAVGLSPSVITRLIETWQQEQREWSERDLSTQRYVYFWADGIFSNVRLSDDRPCALVIIAATADGHKELLAISDGERESTLSWKEVLLDLKQRGLTHAPLLATGDGALGFWAALEEVYPSTRQQLCWVHKTRNVLNALPRKLHVAAKEKLHAIYLSATRADALKQVEGFGSLYGAKYPKAFASLARNIEQLLSFYDFPAEHWQHIRSTNVIESGFATIRHRARQTKGNGSRMATLAMIYKLGREAEKSWRRLNAPDLLKDLVRGVRFIDGTAEQQPEPGEALTDKLAA